MSKHPACLLPASLLAACLLMACGDARAQAGAPQWWGNVNLASYHFVDEGEFLPRGQRFNQFNPGIGAELQWQPRHAFAAGYFRNSVHEDSLYALYHYTPLQVGRFVRAGGMLGLVTGYPGYNDGGLAPAGGLVAKVEAGRIGLNLIYLPEIRDAVPNTLGLQFKWRITR